MDFLSACVLAAGIGMGLGAVGPGIGGGPINIVMEGLDFSGVSRLVSSLRQPAVPLSVYEAREPLRLTHEPPPPYLAAKPAK